MTVTIVGTDDQAKKRCTCRNCAAILEYTFADSKIEVHTDYTGGKDSYRCIICPKCGQELKVPMWG